MLRNILDYRSITYKSCFFAIAGCAILSTIWTTLPLVGWSYYSLEGARISCSVEWQDHSMNVVSYNVTIFVFVFVIPAFIIVFANVKIIQIVCKHEQVIFDV